MMRTRRLSRLGRFAAIALLAGLAGCGDGTHVPAPIEVEHGSAAPGQNSGSAYTVKAGDNIYGIARALNVSARALIDANNLQPPFRVIPGQILLLPGNAVYQVLKGDTLLAISHKTGVAFSTLARINNLGPPYVLQIGQRLTLPARREAVAAAPALAPGLPAAVPPLAATAPASVRSTDLPPPPPHNGGYVPLTAREAPAPSPPAASPAQVAGTLPPPAAVGPPPAVAVNAAPLVAAPPAPVPVAEPVASAVAVGHVPSKPLRGFIWPVKGDILVSFGSPGKGQHNDGINIAVPRGTSVLAAEDGVVAYAGNELRGFGNLLLVKHADGWMSAYAHNGALLVKRGDAVRRGQVIAKSGDSGSVSQPQLHFELRQGTRAVDPEGLLGKAIPEADLADRPDPG